MGKLIFISDIHFTTWQGKMDDKFHAYLKELLLFGTLEINNNENILVIGGDIFNINDMSIRSYDSIIREAELILGKQLRIIRKVLYEINIDINKVILGVGNHEYYNTLIYNGRISRRQAYQEFSLPLIKSIFNTIFNDTEVIYENNYILNNYKIYNSMIYSPIEKIPQYKGISGFINNSKSIDYDKNNELISNLNDFYHFNEVAIDDYNINTDKLINYTEEYEIIEYYNSYLLNSNNLFTNKMNNALLISQREFFFNIFNILNDYIDYRNDYLILNFHFPFNYFDLIKYNIITNSIRIDKNTYEFDDGYINQWYKIPSEWFIWFIDLIIKINPTIKEIIILNGHTHENYTIHANYNGINIKILMNCLGYGKL